LKKNLINENNKLNEELAKYKNICEKLLKEQKTKEGELNRRIKEVEKKEQEFNQRMNFLEDKENIMRKNNKEIMKKDNKFEQVNKDLFNKYKELEKELNEIKIKFSKTPLKLYIRPTLIGLNNIGSTCFMNATLQCLSQTEDLANYFLNINNQEKIINNNNNILSKLYLELVHNLWDKNEASSNKSFSPETFINAVNKMNPLFKKGEAGDSKDIIIYILEQLHKELKKPIKNYNSNNSNGKNLNQYNKMSALTDFFNSFQKETSIISDIFFGFNETTNECLNCKYKYESQGIQNPICYNYGIFNCLIFPLEEVKKMKNNNYNNKNVYINNSSVSLYDCFYYNQQTELFSGANQNYCNICKQTCNSNYTSKIFISPNVLLLILNRGKGNMYNVKLDFTEKIDITQFVLQKDSPQMIYNLYAVITHIGKSGPNAHFVASCKSPIDGNWYRYNDALVSLITNIQSEVIDFGIPYILFYQKHKS
jgi:ubiquitin C-terminal hydrolase